MHTDLYDNASFLFNEIIPKRGREIYFSSKNAHPNANAILSFQMKSKISMHPKQSLKKKIKKRSREHLTQIKNVSYLFMLEKDA